MLKVGLIGAETIGKIHASAYERIHGAKLVGIVDSRQDAAETLGKRLGLPYYTSLEALQTAEQPDILDICTPMDLHKELVMKAAAMGKHVFCEMPIARSKEEATVMIKACRDAGVKFMVGHVLRFFPDYVKAKALVDQQKLGRVGTVRMLRESGMPDRSVTLSGSVVLESMVHDLDWLRWTFGDVERIYAKGLRGNKDAELVLLSVRMKNGVIAHITGSWAHYDGVTTFLEVAGREGVMTMKNDESTMPIRNMVRTEGGMERRYESPIGVSPYQAELQHFVNCVQNDSEPEVSGEEALKTLEVGLAALQSLETGKAITL